MTTSGLVEYKDASPEVRAIYDDIMATRQTDWVNNFWKALARDPATLKRTWKSIKQIMARVGFNDPSHFTRDFTRRHGAPPRAIRERSANLPVTRVRPSSTIRQRTAESANGCVVPAQVLSLSSMKPHPSVAVRSHV